MILEKERHRMRKGEREGGREGEIKRNTERGYIVLWEMYQHST